MGDTSRRSLARHQRLYRRLLLAYPRAFRQVYGADMVQVFTDRLREERRRSGRRASVRVWLFTLLDLFRSAPLQRMETEMTREAACIVLFVLALLTAVVGLAVGIGTVWVGIAGGTLVLATALLFANGAMKRSRSASDRPAGRPGLGQWWLLPAAAGGMTELLFGAGKLIGEPRWENVLALGILGGAGAAVLAGIWRRNGSRSTGDVMIAAGLVPFLGLFWAIWPPIAAGVVIVMALVDSVRRVEPQKV